MHKPIKNSPSFDTLAYSQALKKEGVEHAEAHAVCLANALRQNSQDLYTKAEVEKMIEATLKEFSTSMHEMNERIGNNIHEMNEKTARSLHEMNTKFDARTHAIEKNLEKSNAELKTESANLRTEMVKMNARTISIIVSILGALIVIMGTIGHVGHRNIQNAIRTQQTAPSTNTPVA